MLLISFLVPLLLAWFVSHFAPLNAKGRYEMTIFPLFVLLLAILWSEIDYRFLLIALLLSIYFTNKQVVEHRSRIEGYVSDDRRIAEEIVGRLEENDKVTTTDLSWATMYYYITRLTDSKKIVMRSFPGEIELHPGCKNIVAMLGKKEAYKKEASLLLAEIEANTEQRNVWVINNSANDINALLVGSLKIKFADYERIEPGAPRENLWFDELYRFKKTN